MCELLRVVQGQVHDYNDVLGAFEQVWNLRGGILRGIGHSSAVWSGVCRTLARLRRSLCSSFGPVWCAARSYISEARGRGFCEVRLSHLQGGSHSPGPLPMSLRRSWLRGVGALLRPRVALMQLDGVCAARSAAP